MGATVFDQVILRDSLGDNSDDLSNSVPVTEVFANHFFGGPANLWNPTRAWTPSRVNGATFEVRVGMNCTLAEEEEAVVGVDVVEIEVFYTLPGGGGVQRQTRCVPIGVLPGILAGVPAGVPR